MTDCDGKIRELSTDYRNRWRKWKDYFLWKTRYWHMKPEKDPPNKLEKVQLTAVKFLANWLNRKQLLGSPKIGKIGMQRSGMTYTKGLQRPEMTLNYSAGLGWRKNTVTHTERGLTTKPVRIDVKLWLYSVLQSNMGVKLLCKRPNGRWDHRMVYQDTKLACTTVGSKCG